MRTADIIEYAGIEPQPWKNGRGITRNLFDDADASGGWTWRVSIAEITGEQPYSPYPGVRRGQVALGPGDVELTIDGRRTVLPPHGVIVFDGEAEVSARPTSPGFLDLNVMVRRADWEARVEISTDPRLAAEDLVEPGCDEPAFVVLVALDDGCTVGGRTLRRLDSARVTAAPDPGCFGRFAVTRVRAAR